MVNFASVNPKNLFNNVYEDYDRYVYVPVILVFLSVIVLLAGYLTPGSALNLGQDFTGGTTIKYELPADYDTNQINQIFPPKDILVQTQLLSVRTRVFSRSLFRRLR